MSILHTIFGCLLGCIVYKLISLVVPLSSFGDYSIALLVALCLIFVAIVASFPWPVRNISA